MLLSDSVRALLRARRERRRLLTQGYHPHETNPEIIRGNRRDEVIVEPILAWVLARGCLGGAVCERRPARARNGLELEVGYLEPWRYWFRLLGVAHTDRLN